MGLDMMLTKTRFYTPTEDNKELFKILKGEVAKDAPVSVTTGVIYWRKANAINKWFWDNCDDLPGTDNNCREIDITIEHLKELLELCRKVKNRKVDPKVELPTEEGFFFGDTDYDDYYYESIEYTIKEIKKVIKNHKPLDTYKYSCWY